MSEGLVLGIDGGGSKTLIALADRTGGIVRVGRGKGVNPMDNRMWRGELDEQLRARCQPDDLNSQRRTNRTAFPIRLIFSPERDFTPLSDG
jgi:hypothetical protein